MKTALITGTSSGHGAALAKLMLGKGWRIIGISRSSSRIDHPRFSEVVVDLLSSECDRILKEHSQSLDHEIDVIVNNAGMAGKGSSVKDVSSHEMLTLFDLHVCRPLTITQIYLPQLLRSTRPLILNISSRLASVRDVAAGRYDELNVSYSMRISKAALNMASACLYRELKEKGVSVFALNPGTIKTRMGNKDAELSAEAAAELTYNFIMEPGDAQFLFCDNRFTEYSY